MRYPVLTESKLTELSPKLLEGLQPAIATEQAWVGQGEEIDLDAIADLVSTIWTALGVFTRGDDADERDVLEGQLSGTVHATLSELPIEVLDDPGLWRYLSVRAWPFVSWRESKTFAKGGYDDYHRYIDGRSPTECVLMRMYLRGSIAFADGDYALASAVPRAVDLWRSHILRVRTGTAPSLARALVAEQERDRMPTSALRPFASSVNRLWSNVVINVYDDQEAAELIAELRDSTT